MPRPVRAEDELYGRSDMDDTMILESAQRLRVLIGRTLERIEITPLGVMFHFSSLNGDSGAVYWAVGGPDINQRRK